MARCCPGFDAHAIRCSDAAVTGGGCAPIQPGRIKRSEADCILDQPCDALASVCARVGGRAACVGPICDSDADCIGGQRCVEGRCAGCDDAGVCSDGGVVPLAPPCPAAASPVCP